MSFSDSKARIAAAKMPPQMRPTSFSTKHSDVSAIIRKSSRFLKHQDMHYKRGNPCRDDQVYYILSESLRTHQVGFRKLLRYATWGDYFLMAFGLIFSFLAALVYVATIHSFGLFYQFFHNETSAPCMNVRTYDGPGYQLKYPYMWFSITLVVFSFFKNILLDLSAERQCKRLQLAYVEAIVRKDCTWFESYHDRDLPFRVRKDMQEIRLGIGESLGKLVFYTTVSILMLAASFSLNMKVAIIPLLIVPAFTIFSVLKVRAAKAIHEDEHEAYKPANEFAAQMLEKIQTIKLFCGEAIAVEDYEASLYSPWDLRKPIFLTALWASLCWFISMATHPFLIWFCIYFFDDYHEKLRKIDSAQCDTSIVWVCPNIPLYVRLDTILMYLTFAVYFLSNLPIVYLQVRRAQFVAADAFFCIDWKAGIDNISDEGHIPRFKVIGKVVIKNVTFNYPIRPQNEVLVGVNIAVFPGQMVAIFGPTKCGKTTVLRLLLRKYDICRGFIQLDGTDLHTLNIPWLRSQIGYVSQYPVFLNGTIEENLCGPLKPSMEEIIRVCRKVDVISDIQALPAGFQTMVGSNSKVNLSLLQIRKIHLARILLRKCRVVLLDDFFSNMDGTNEAFMVDLFETMRENITLIITSRNINALMKTCDTVFVMKEGQIVQIGNHDNISKTRGYYMDLLQESLQEPRQTFVTKPKTESQLVYYKFAEAIRRIHDLHDYDNHHDYSKIYENKKVISSVLLRHNTRNKGHLLPFRLTGGYYKFVTFYALMDTNYNLLRHHLVQERDLRIKITPDPELDGYPGIQGNLRSKPVTIQRLSLDDEINYPESNFIADSSMSSDSRTRTEIEAENVIEMIFATSKKSNNKSSDSGKTPEDKQSRILEWKASGLARLQHYFGWILNSPVDTDSICSEDSYLFWDAYSRRLQLSNKKCRDPITFFGFIKLAKYSWPYFIFAFVTSTTMGLCLVFSVTETAHALRVYLTEKGSHEVMSVLPRIVYVACLAFVVVFVQETVIPFALCSVNRFRVSHFASILEQNMRWFASPRNDIEYLCEFLATDISAVNITIFEWIVIYSESSVVLVSLAVIVVLYSGALWLESLTLLFIVPFLIIINCLQTITHEMKAWKRPTKSESLMYDMMSNIQHVVAQDLCGHILGLYIEYEFGTNKTVSKRLNYVWSILAKNLISALSRASFLLSFSIWSIISHNQETYTAEQAAYFLTVTYLLLYGIFPMGFAIGMTPTYKNHADSASFISETHKVINDGKSHSKKLQYSLVLEKHKPPPSLTFSRVSCADSVFSDVTALHRVSFEVPSGHYVAIVSQSIHAKIAIMGLILKLYYPVEGDIFLNDTNYNELEDRSVRRGISVIPQDPDLFMDLTIAENIAYGDNSRVVADFEIVQAAKMTLLHEIVVEMPESYNTKLKDLPINPEIFAVRQRIAVARAAVRDSQIVVVNEMTVSVDEDCDLILMRALMNLRQGRTFIVISQRIQPIRGANSIVFINEGTVAEVGTDMELIKKRGLYYEMHMSQQLYERRTDSSDKAYPLYSASSAYFDQ